MNERVEIPEYLRKDTATRKAEFIRHDLIPRFEEINPTLTFKESGEVLGGIIDYAVGPLSVCLEVKSKDLVEEAQNLESDLERKNP